MRVCSSLSYSFVMCTTNRFMQLSSMIGFSFKYVRVVHDEKADTISSRYMYTFMEKWIKKQLVLRHDLRGWSVPRPPGTYIYPFIFFHVFNLSQVTLRQSSLRLRGENNDMVVSFWRQNPLTKMHLLRTRWQKWSVPGKPNACPAIWVLNANAQIPKMVFFVWHTPDQLASPYAIPWPMLCRELFLQAKTSENHHLKKNIYLPSLSIIYYSVSSTEIESSSTLARLIWTLKARWFTSLFPQNTI